MNVEIEDSLYAKYERLIKSRFPGGVPWRLHDLIEDELRRWGGDDYRDPLTGCKTRWQLSEGIRRATTEYGHEFYRSDFACLDIKDFKSYLDNTGIADGDRVLRNIGKQLQETYSEANVYRFGGDEFVVELRGQPYRLIQTPSEISLQHSIVKIVAKKNPHRDHYINQAILFHLDRGIVEATREGTEIACEIVTR